MKSNNKYNGSNEYEKAIDFLEKGCKCGCSLRIPKPYRKFFPENVRKNVENIRYCANVREKLTKGTERIRNCAFFRKFTHTEKCAIPDSFRTFCKFFPYICAVTYIFHV